MTINITAVHMEPSSGDSHQHIAAVFWDNAETAAGESEYSTREQMIEWINRGGDARVRDGQGSVKVGVVEGTPPYLRTYADGRWTDNLLSLPRY